MTCDCFLAVTIVVSSFEMCWWDNLVLIEGLWFCGLCEETATAIEYVLVREYVSPKTAAMDVNDELIMPVTFETPNGHKHSQTTRD